MSYIGAIGLLWFFVWQLAIHGSPSEHPTITPEEKEYIEESIAKLPAAKVNMSWLGSINLVCTRVRVAVAHPRAKYKPLANKKL